MIVVIVIVVGGVVVVSILCRVVAAVAVVVLVAILYCCCCCTCWCSFFLLLLLFSPLSCCRCLWPLQPPACPQHFDGNYCDRFVAAAAFAAPDTVDAATVLCSFHSNRWKTDSTEDCISFCAVIMVVVVGTVIAVLDVIIISVVAQQSTEQ